MRTLTRLLLLAAALSLSACAALRPADAPIEHWKHLPSASYGDD
jgi:hypothetical protein